MFQKNSFQFVVSSVFLSIILILSVKLFWVIPNEGLRLEKTTQHEGLPSWLEKNDHPDEICLMTYASEGVPFHFEKPGAAKPVI
jgi:hypothetical protein